MEKGQKRIHNKQIASHESKRIAMTQCEEQNNPVKEFNKLSSKIVLNLSSMEVNSAYTIVNCERKETQYGPRILLELENNMLYLPVRYNVMSDESLEELKESKYIVINRGEMGRSFLLEISKVSPEIEYEENSQNKLPEYNFYYKN